MSQLVVRSNTDVDSIPITRRISEIMHDKGKYYTMTAMASRIGLHRETLRTMLKGEREIYTFELEKIARDLKTTPERILQEDYRNEAKELIDLLNERKEPERALVLAEKLSSAALGVTEKCIYLNYLGWALFSLQDFEKAHHIWQNAFELAKEVSKKYGEIELCYRVMRNLMLTYIELKEYSNALRVSEHVETMFEARPIVLAELYYIQAKVKESQSDNEEALRLCYKSLENTKKAENNEMIGRSFINVAHFEYFLGNYSKSIEMLESALEFLGETRFRLIAQKDLAKSFIKLGKLEKATNLIQTTLNEAMQQKHDLLVGKLKLLLSRATGQIIHAQEVAHSEEFDYTIRKMTCMFIMDHYKSLGDSFNFMHYHGIAEMLNQTSEADILDLKEL